MFEILNSLFLNIGQSVDPFHHFISIFFTTNYHKQHDGSQHHTMAFQTHPSTRLLTFVWSHLHFYKKKKLGDDFLAVIY